MLFFDVLSIELLIDGSWVSFPDKLAGRCALCSRVGFGGGSPWALPLGKEHDDEREHQS